MGQVTQEDIDRYLKQTQKDFKRNAAILGALFVIFAVVIYYVIMNLPTLSEDEVSVMYRIPRNGAQLSAMAQVIKAYTQTNHTEVLAAFCCLYVFLQTFAIPGAVFLSILSGALFGPYLGFSLVCLCATSGACI